MSMRRRSVPSKAARVQLANRRCGGWFACAPGAGSDPFRGDDVFQVAPMSPFGVRSGKWTKLNLPSSRLSLKVYLANVMTIETAKSSKMSIRRTRPRFCSGPDPDFVRRGSYARRKRSVPARSYCKKPRCTQEKPGCDAMSRSFRCHLRRENWRQ
jgi:hypothetical protein